MNKESAAPKIIFILGIMPRSGTHFLANLLCQHPDCDKSVFAEDGLLASADFLSKYVNQINKHWEIDGNLPKISNLMPKNLLLESLGQGLIKFLINAKELSLEKKAEKFDKANLAVKNSLRLITKTPQVANIDKFFKLFPDEQLLIIVRDGRALIESAGKSFGYNREEAMRDWAAAARKIFRFVENQPDKKSRFLIVKYEELHACTEREMKKILNFLKLDADKYDFQKALDLPVVGSSVFKRGDGDVHWLPVKKTGEFDPLARAANWTRAEHERFNWLAKDELIKFDYAPIEFSGGKIRWKVWNVLRDVKWEANIWLRRVPKLFRFVGKRLNVYFRKR